ncbi:unnamed protein product [Hapterophycus canaliculatus]
MSSIPPFLVGLVASGVGYAYLSRDLVTSRNELMLKHFKADGVEPYYPSAKFGRPRRDCTSRQGSGSGSDNISSVSPPAPAPAGEHDLVRNARNKWNAAVFQCSEAIMGALYGGSAGDAEVKADGDNDGAPRS